MKHSGMLAEEPFLKGVTELGHVKNGPFSQLSSCTVHGPFPHCCAELGVWSYMSALERHSVLL